MMILLLYLTEGEILKSSQPSSPIHLGSALTNGSTDFSLVRRGLKRISTQPDALYPRLVKNVTVPNEPVPNYRVRS